MNATIQIHAQRIGRPLRFGLVGLSGIAVNSAVLWALVRTAGLPVALGSLFATEIAIISNFILNDRWTFRAADSNWPARLLRFNGVALGGMALTALLLTLMMHSLHLPLLVANVLAVGAATVWNYVANSRWTWSAGSRQHAAADAPSSGIDAFGYETLPDRDEEVAL